MPMLQYLSLKACKIRKIYEDAFHGLTRLSYLDLSGNVELKSLSSDTFLKLTVTASLNLSSNPQLDFRRAINFTKITWLDLSFCNLSSLPPIGPLSKIHNIDLSNNEIVEFTGQEYYGFEHLELNNLNLSHNKIALFSINKMNQLLPSLKSLDIGDNPFDCQSCALPEFKLFLTENTHLIQNLGSNNSLKCVYPVADKGKEIYEVDYVCHPLWLTIGSLITALGLIVIILMITFCYIYRFEITYAKEMWLIKRRNERKSVRRAAQCEFDGFVSYCAADRSWVMDILLPNLESVKDCYSLCLHERDFRLGSFIMDNIVESIEKSRRVLFVLSNSFLQSEVSATLWLNCQTNDDTQLFLVW
jgi:toll-like receptor 2